MLTWLPASPERMRSVFKRKNVVQDTIASYLNPEGGLQLSESLDFPPSKAGLICFALVQAKDSELVIAADSARLTIAEAFAHGGNVACVMSSLILVTFGIPLSSGNDWGKCQDFVVELANEHSGSIRIVFGRVQGNYGSIGGQDTPFMFYTPCLPNFGDYLRELTTLQFGSYKLVVE